MSNSKKGIIFTISGGIFWGLSSVCGQYLFNEKGLNAKWLVTMRLIIAGVIMVFASIGNEKDIKGLFKIWSDKKDVFQLLLFGIFGMAACQLTYYVTVEIANASTATVLQYTAPVLIMLYLSLKNRIIPKFNEIIALILVVTGTFFLVTHGNIHNLAISRTALIWGLSSAVTVVFYNLIPAKLMNKFGTVSVLGWGMIIGGIFMTLITKPWIVPGVWDFGTYVCFVMLIIAGTVFSFGMYLEGVKLIGASKASLFASSEPLTASVAVALFMGVSFEVMDIVGLVCILMGVTILSLHKIDVNN